MFRLFFTLSIISRKKTFRTTSKVKVPKELIRIIIYALGFWLIHVTNGKTLAQFLQQNGDLQLINSLCNLLDIKYKASGIIHGISDILEIK